MNALSAVDFAKPVVQNATFVTPKINFVTVIFEGEQSPSLGEQDLAVRRVCGLQHSLPAQLGRPLLRRQQAGLLRTHAPVHSQGQSRLRSQCSGSGEP
jgi:hypothetical protein